MSSRIQKPRPCVPTTRSLSCTTRSRADVGGRLRRSACQWRPSSNETYTPRSVPAYKSPRRAGSSRTAFTTAFAGSPSTISVQVRPPSPVRYTCGRRSASRKRFTAAYATRVSNREASSSETLLHGVSAGGVTSVHVRPPVCVTWIKRSEEHTSELQSLAYLVCRLLLAKKHVTL